MKRSVFEVPDRVDVDKLVKAWEKIITMNPILRTRIVEIENLGLMQLVVKDIPWVVSDKLTKHLLDKEHTRADLGSPLAQWATIFEDGTYTVLTRSRRHVEVESITSRVINDCIHNIVFDVVLRQPDAPAICGWNGRLAISSWKMRRHF